jgi:hypothetical protein
MGSLKTRGVVLLLAWALVVAVIGCMGARATDRTVAENGGSFVRVERDRSAPRVGVYGHPVSLSPERVHALLGGIEVESRLGPFLGQLHKEPLFDQSDLDFLAPAVSAGLEQARPDERVIFYLRQSGRLLRSEITTGAFAVTGDAMAFTLGHYRRTDVEGLVQEDRQANLESEIRADPMFRVLDRNVRLFVQAGKPGRVDGMARTVLLPLSAMISTEAVVRPDRPRETVDKPAPAPPVSPTPPAKAATVPPKSEKANAPPVSSTVSGEVLQQQVKDLAESNQALRAKLKQAQEGQQSSQSVNEELIRLRQELEEAKQLLAEKVLELNRLKKKTE